MSFTHPHIEWGLCPDCWGPSLRVAGSLNRVCQRCKADPTDPDGFTLDPDVLATHSRYTSGSGAVPKVTDRTSPDPRGP